ncbi:Mor transcription activator family protein [Marinisporobacter balticus]|uniref:Mor transcription activator family protein n=1 Tax=Marinisporobacter balticus TaxID=2018667 RepID=A0A4R2KE83_9FIRM|nr:Mor transcription activator family protein [Marinisporobacter balticus]TCO70662.1 Mor transcription activator family protein [Marinisporobacter balticus]
MQMCRVAEIIGKENTQKLILEFGGTILYIPKEGFKSERDQKIIAEYDGYNAKKLAKKYALCEKQIKNIVERSKK